MHKRHNEPMRFISTNLPTALVDRIQQAARHRSIMERRTVPYVELVRKSLERDFPPETATQSPPQ